MAELKTEITWLLTLTNKEFLLILKSLRGATRDDEIEASHELDLKLSAYRVQCLRQHSVTADQIEKWVNPNGQDN